MSSKLHLRYHEKYVLCAAVDEAADTKCGMFADEVIFPEHTRAALRSGHAANKHFFRKLRKLVCTVFVNVADGAATPLRLSLSYFFQGNIAANIVSLTDGHSKLRVQAAEVGATFWS